MAGRLFIILTVGLTLAAAMALAIADIKQRADFQRARTQSTVSRLSDIAHFLDNAPASQRRDLLRQGVPGARFASEPIATGVKDTAFTAALAHGLSPSREVVALQVAADNCRPPRPGGGMDFDDTFGDGPDGGAGPPPPPTCWLISFSLSTGERVHVLQGGPPDFSGYTRLFNPTYLSVLTIAAALLAFVVSRIVTSALDALAAAAVELGDNLERTPLPERGPQEVRAAARSFNSMQQRLRTTLRERTHMLAAITHDLQTPLTRMRLRVEKIEASEMRARLIDDISSMQSLIAEGLDLARAIDVVEHPSVLDLDSLIESLVEDAREAGHDATMSTEDQSIDVRASPQALRRCVSNLLDNAIRHGGSAEVGYGLDAEGLTIRVRDHGPGVPEHQLEAMFEPFVRLEESRSRETGGTGLGLTIARMLAHKVGAELTLANHREGGLEARLVMPVSLIARTRTM